LLPGRAVTCQRSFWATDLHFSVLRLPEPMMVSRARCHTVPGHPWVLLARTLTLAGDGGLLEVPTWANSFWVELGPGGWVPWWVAELPRGMQDGGMATVYVFCPGSSGDAVGAGPVQMPPAVPTSLRSPTHVLCQANPTAACTGV